MSTGVYRQGRRGFIKAIGGLGLALACRPAWVAAQPHGLIRKPIPSSGEQLPVIGMGTSRTFDVGDDAQARAALLPVLQAFFDQGGALIECLSYRLGDHTTADDARRYRDDETVSRHWKEEPIVRLRNHLVAAHGWTKQDEENLLQESRADAEAAAERYLAIAPQPARAMFEHLYDTLPTDIADVVREMGDA